MVFIETGKIKIAVNPLGAELCSIYHKENQLEYIWQAGKEWPKHSPVLFPIVGSLKNDLYYHNGNAYSLSRHGFAREKKFSLKKQASHQLIFQLKDDEDSIKVYPFHFILEIIYTLINDTLQVTYSVYNTGEDMMYFSIGAHPAFNVPLISEKIYEDYILEFDNPLTEEIWHLENTLIAEYSKPFLQNTLSLKLTKSLFKENALVFKGFNSSSIKLTDTSHQHGLYFNLNGCPYLGLWAAKNANFICIEPWYGIADSVNTNQELKDKEGIQSLSKGKEFRCSWSVELF